ncbi:MAG TPA: CRTAC1 family protein [Vicinamibacterales bacterium]|nr:CRTAC1 family protein [Vicinamibacterales bacterium]
MTRVVLICLTVVVVGLAGSTDLAQTGGGAPAAPVFEAVQPELFAASGGQPNAWADFDSDGDLDQFVGFRMGIANRLYRNDAGTFVDVAAAAGVADLTDTRSAAWGDFDADGDPDLYVGFTRKSETPGRVYRNEAGRFTDVAKSLGIDVVGETRQPAWVDFDRDGDLDLFVALRDAPNLLFRNDGDKFTSVGKELGMDDPRRTVGAVWFDMDQDGDLDLFVANQNGDNNAMYRNDGARFVEVGAELGVNAAGRPQTSGSNGPGLADYDNDGDLDLFVAGYGNNYMYRADGPAKFTEVSSELGLAGGDKATPSRWGDFDHDGRIDVYVSSYIDKPLNEKDFLYRNEGGRFTNAMPENIAKFGATHGVVWVDFDKDGDLDLALANNNPKGGHPLYRNLLPANVAARSVQVRVVDARGRDTQAGAEVRVFAAGTRKLLGMGIVDSGGGYCSQSVMPVHVGLATDGRVDVEVTSMTPSGRAVTRAANITPANVRGRVLVVKVAPKGRRGGS